MAASDGIGRMFTHILGSAVPPYQPVNKGDLITLRTADGVEARMLVTDVRRGAGPGDVTVDVLTDPDDERWRRTQPI